jgi:hypothetical protein
MCDHIYNFPIEDNTTLQEKHNPNYKTNTNININININQEKDYKNINQEKNYRTIFITN